MSLTLTKDRYGYPVQGKREGNSPQQATTTQAPARQETADRSNVLRGQVFSLHFLNGHLFIHVILAGADKA